MAQLPSILFKGKTKARSLHVYMSLFDTAIKIETLSRYMRSSINWVNKGTGLPVAPFAFPEFQAVPAISTCAQV